MEAKAVAKTIRIAPRKVRLVLDLIRGKSAGEAIAILKLKQSFITCSRKIINVRSSKC